jgi:RecJ-like exonuclease
VDHHPPANVIEKHLLVQVNPRLVHSTYDFCSGMLCAEIAHALLGHPKHDHDSHLAFIAAVSAVADKVASTEAEQYHTLAEKEGFSKELIGRCAAALDFEAHALGPSNGRETIHDLLGRDKKRQEELLAIIEKQLVPAR